MVTLNPLMPLYTLERSPPSAGVKAAYSAFAIEWEKLPFARVAMLSEGEGFVGQKKKEKN